MIRFTKIIGLAAVVYAVTFITFYLAGILWVPMPDPYQVAPSRNLRAIEVALELYRSDTGTYPTSLTDTALRSYLASADATPSAWVTYKLVHETSPSYSLSASVPFRQEARLPGIPTRIVWLDWTA